MAVIDMARSIRYLRSLFSSAAHELMSNNRRRWGEEATDPNVGTDSDLNLKVELCFGCVGVGVAGLSSACRLEHFHHHHDVGGSDHAPCLSITPSLFVLH